MKKIVLIIIVCYYNCLYANELSNNTNQLSNNTSNQIVDNKISEEHNLNKKFNSIDDINLSNYNLIDKKKLIEDAIKEGLIDAKQEQIINIIIKDHKFTPKYVVAHNGSRIKILVHNQDATPEEFESNKLNREKIIPGNSKATIVLPVLKPGEYDFFGEFHPDNANGILEVINIENINK
ncbi:MAG: cupredoxin domain-containing protein [Rickettsiales bacterium]